MTHIIVRDANVCQATQKILAKCSAQLNNSRIMKTKNTVEEIRLANLRLLIEECEAATMGKKTYRAGTAAALAAMSKTSASYLSQILIRFRNPSGNIREVGTELARKLEKGAKKPVGWMDVRHDDVDSAENELRLLYAAMDESGKATLVAQARLISQIGKKK
jgi:hypothetical protein